MPYNIYAYYNSHVEGEIFKLIPKKEYSEVLEENVAFDDFGG